MKSKKAFTILELLVVISIIGILAAIVLPSIDKIRARSRDSKRIADISQMRLALEHYFNVYNKYPVDLNDTNLVQNGVLPSLPKDPKTNADYLYASYGPSSGCGATPKPNGYHLGAVFEQPNTETDSDADVTSLPAGKSVCASNAPGGVDFNGIDTAGCASDVAGYCYDFREQ